MAETLSERHISEEIDESAVVDALGRYIDGEYVSLDELEGLKALYPDVFAKNEEI